ncbi:MAG: hypothetical protein B7Z08_02990 [Sphingomonadales bacterium 32-68-7]|nr:MAG: hypothetical protein B7Z08_02990 [Sphingomonadales bacterium 32-68-7]
MLSLIFCGALALFAICAVANLLPNVRKRAALQLVPGLALACLYIYSERISLPDDVPVATLYWTAFALGLVATFFVEVKNPAGVVRKSKGTTGA